MGTPAAADPGVLPDFSFIDATPETAKFHGLIPTAANYQLITDNLLDLSHVAFLHPTTFGDILHNAKMSVEERDSVVCVRWNAIGSEPPDTSPYRAFVPAGLADIWAGVDWAPPAMMVINSGAVPTGVPPKDTDQIYALHSLTPATLASTHYFYCVTRKFATDSREVTAVMKQGAELAFTSEDKPMVEAQQTRTGGEELFALKPVLLSVDTAAVRVRRKLERLIATESQRAVPTFAEPGT
jgi:vanillate O-demethylase monooxygenase subunit